MPTSLYFHTTPAAYPAPTAGKKSTALPTGTDNTNARIVSAGTATFENISFSETAPTVFPNAKVATLAQTTLQSGMICRASSRELAAQTIPAQTWTFILNTAETNAAANAVLALSVYVWRPSTAAVVGYVYDSAVEIGIEFAGEATRTFAGASVASQLGDILVTEVWYRATQGMATAYEVSATFSATSKLESPAVLAWKPLAKIGTFSDNYDDNVIDAAKWDQISFGSATVAETAQQLQLTSAAATSSYSGLQSKVDYDFTESNIAIRAVQPQDQHFSHENYFIALPSSENPNDPQNLEGWYISNGSIRALKKVAGTATFMWSDIYSATTHAWLRLRHAGSLLYFDTATSSASNPPVEADWVNKYSVTPSFDMTAKRLQIQAGGYDLAHAGDTGIWDTLHATSSSLPERIGTLSQTLGAATVASSGTVAISAALSKTLGASTVASSGTVASTATASNTLGAATSTASGTVASTATASNTLGAATTATTGTVSISAQSARTLDAASADSSATNAITATSSTTLGATAISATGVTGSAISGSLTQTLGEAGISASGQAAIAAQANIATGAASLSAAATGLVSGQANSTLAAASINATGSLQTSGQANASLGNTTLAASGTAAQPQAITGTLSASLGGMSANGTGQVAAAAQAAATLSSMSAAASGQVSIAANGSVVMGAVAADSQGAASLAAILSAQLGAATVSSTGSVYTPDTATVRIYTIDAENRVFVVAPESRMHTIAAESRSHTIEPEVRLHAVAAEDRVHTVAPENRTRGIT